MRSVIIALLFLLITGGCKNKQQTVADVVKKPEPSIDQGASSDSAKLPPRKSAQRVGAITGKKKPEPPVPVEQMTRVQLTDYKKLLKENGFYDCCVERDCRMCIFELEECACKQSVKKKQAVCSECYDGWQAGKGNIKGIKAEDVIKP